MQNIKLKGLVLKYIRICGPLSIPELVYLIENDNYSFLILDYEIFNSKDMLKKYIRQSLKKLFKSEEIRIYQCQSGYKERYGIFEKSIPIQIPLKLTLKINLEKCQECLSWVVNYNDKYKHLTVYFCKSRETTDEVHLKYYDYEGLKFILYKYFLLGIFEKGKLRLPFKNNKTYNPELIIASKIFRSKNLEYKNRKYLKFNFKKEFI